MSANRCILFSFVCQIASCADNSVEHAPAIFGLWVAAGLAACSVKPVTFTPGGDDQLGDAQLGDAMASASVLSCVGLPMTCGASGNDNCCNSPAVAGGTYYRSYDLAGDRNSGNTMYPATVSNFRLDKYEVTVGRFRAFVNAGMGTQTSPPMPGAGAHANIAGSGWDASWNASLATDKAALVAAVKCNATYPTWTDISGANEHRPMNCVTWYEAMAFCAWDGGYLATEAEWNYAATGGDQQRAYPWSMMPAGSLGIDDTRASYYGDGTKLTDLVAVGTKPAGDGLWRQSDLAGNVWEWTLDGYATYASTCIDCAALTPMSSRVIRGGGFLDVAATLRAGLRSNPAPAGRGFAIGLRCARSAP